MRNVWIIAKREYLERVRAKSFLIMTILIPALMIGVSVVPSLIATRSSGGTKKIVLVTADPQTGAILREELLDLNKPKKEADMPGGQRGPLTTTHYDVTVETDVSDASRRAFTEKVKAKQLDGVIWASDEALASRKFDYITLNVSSFIDTSILERAISVGVRRQMLKGKGLTDADIQNALKPVDLAAISPEGKDKPDPQKLFLTVLALVMVLYMTILLYGVNVMRAILEEKTSRVMEVMLSTATSQQMMTGKILGVSAVGLTQVGIWSVVAGALPLLVASSAGTFSGVLSTKLLVYFAVYFLLGFALYSTLCAAIGAMVNSEQEAQQLQIVVMMPLILAVIIMVNIIQYPSSPLAFWASLFPFTSPLIMLTRLALQPPHTWEIALSIALLVAAVFGCAWLCGRIYRVGILMYGKKPTLPEILKWIKYA
ncbi:MAG: ABC transporter permease [Acidobacteriia bacterium]|nr:ABC transporter permease [Terriglobia bacterium]